MKKFEDMSNEELVDLFCKTINDFKNQTNFDIDSYVEIPIYSKVMYDSFIEEYMPQGYVGYVFILYIYDRELFEYIVNDIRSRNLETKIIVRYLDKIY